MQVLWDTGRAAEAAFRDRQGAAVLEAALQEGAPLPPPPRPWDLRPAPRQSPGQQAPLPPGQGLEAGALRWGAQLGEFRHMRSALDRPPLQGRHAKQARPRRHEQGRPPPPRPPPPPRLHWLPELLPV